MNFRTNQDLVRIQRVYQDAQNGGRSEVFEIITQRMEEEMTKYIFVILKNKRKIFRFPSHKIFVSYSLLRTIYILNSRYLSLRASLLVPDMLKLLAKFHATTAFWLVQVYLNDAKIGENAENDYIPKECKEVTFPLPETVPDTLRYFLNTLFFRLF